MDFGSGKEIPFLKKISAPLLAAQILNLLCEKRAKYGLSKMKLFALGDISKRLPKSVLQKRIPDAKKPCHTQKLLQPNQQKYECKKL